MRALIALAIAVAAAAGCTSDPDPGPRFDDEGAAGITCMRHQPAMPGPHYTDAARRVTVDTLPLLRYYTANGRRGYCDGAGPTDPDRGWARVYVDLGADRVNVATLLG